MRCTERKDIHEWMLLWSSESSPKGIDARSWEVIPSAQGCFSLMDRYGMLENIRHHSIVVAKVASLITQGLKETGIGVCVEKVVAGALLHDIGKTFSLSSGGDHAEMGKEICYRHHFDEIADIVAEHVTLRNYDQNDSGCWEKEVVYYSDKRVNDDKIVTLEERERYILRRYGRGGEHVCRLIRENFELCRKVEVKLFRRLPFRPEDLSERVKH